MSEFYIGQIFLEEYPPQAAEWCNEQGTCFISEIEPNEDGINQFQIVESPKETAYEREERFTSNFFQIPPVEGIFEGGWYRKKPKGYSSAIESMNTIFNAVSVIGNLPAGNLTFYVAPDFKDETQCTEEWLVANQFKNDEMTAAEFGQFYAAFITVWNSQEHK